MPHALKNSHGQVIVPNLVVANTTLSRLIGLLNHSVLPENAGMLLTQCSQVHTLFMRFPIDVVFLNSKKEILGIESLKPWRFSKFYLKARFALELPVGAATKLGLNRGQTLEVCDV